MPSFRKYIPNLLSLLRIFLMVPFVLFLKNNNVPALIAVSAMILLTDFLDGMLARAWDSVTGAGKILDPLADKVCTVTAAISLISLRGFPLWLFGVILLRDLIILVGGLTLIRVRRLVPVSNIIGRISITLISFCMLSYVFEIESLKAVAAVVMVAVSAASVVSYSFYFLKATATNRHGIS